MKIYEKNLIIIKKKVYLLKAKMSLFLSKYKNKNNNKKGSKLSKIKEIKTKSNDSYDESHCKSIPVDKSLLKMKSKNSKNSKKS